jgi:large subunit ribosomal protein L23
MTINLVKNIVLTEKSVRLIENNQYTFDVSCKLTKSQIKKIIETFFKVKVISVNTHKLTSKTKGNLKRVIVTLKNGYSIPLFS